MPPRTKQRANRQIGAPSYDSDRFWGMHAEKQYDDVWCHKPVVVERVWLINQFRGEEFMLHQNFESRQWLSIAQFQASCVSEVVREFFANIREGSINKQRGREHLTGWVRGVEIKLIPQDFAAIFQLPRVQQPEFSYPAEGGPSLNVIAREILIENQEWSGEYRKPLSALTAKYWALHMFSCTNLLPQNRNSDCSRARARLIYAIGTGMTLDLPSYIWHHIAFTFEQKGGQTGIPFGGALTEIFRRKGAQIPADLPIAPRLQPLTVVSYAKSRGNVEKSKKKKRSEASGSQRPWDEVDDEEDEPEISMANLVAQINRMEHNQEADHALLIRMEQTQREMQQEQRTQTHLLRSLLDHFHDSQHPPPSH